MGTIINLSRGQFYSLSIGEVIKQKFVEDNSWAETFAKEGDNIEVRNNKDYLLVKVVKREDHSIDNENKAIRLTLIRNW